MAFFFLTIVWTAVSAQIVPFDSDRWEIRANESTILDHLGQKSLFMKNGLALVKGSVFTDGVIEFDIAFTGERGFMGAVWRAEDFMNYEEFYLRPHQSGQPDANQYEPVANGVETWQLYYGERYAAPVKYDFNQWVHVKIIVSGRHAEMYIKEMTTPVLIISELKREIVSGGVGLRVGEFSGAYFSNFQFTAMNNPPLKGKSKAPEQALPGTVKTWMVSNAFERKSLEKKYQLASDEKQKLRWTRLGCETSGLANLALVQGIQDGKNTAFAKVVIHSEREQVKKVTFGFSDAVMVYFNDRLIYGGNDGYRTRDHRFLGTIGLFDELWLPMKKGENELWMAVTEDFGGWGLMARFEDMSGIRFEEGSKE